MSTLDDALARMENPDNFATMDDLEAAMTGIIDRLKAGERPSRAEVLDSLSAKAEVIAKSVIDREAREMTKQMVGAMALALPVLQADPEVIALQRDMEACASCNLTKPIPCDMHMERGLDVGKRVMSKVMGDAS